MSSKIFLGSNVAELEIGEKRDKYSKVILTRDKDTWFTAGTDEGNVLEASSPWATQDMANSILDKVSGYEYLPYDATSAILDPAAEIGDGVTLGGIYSEISSIDMSLDMACLVDISAPGVDEIEDEYPYRSSANREIDRELKRNYSLITKTDEEIRTLIEDVSGQISTIEQYVDGITLSVTNSETSSQISLSSGDITIASADITFSGFVTFEGLSGGTTTIDGDCIQTGKIASERLELTGAISFTDLSDSMQTRIKDSERNANDAIDSVDAWTYTGTTYIDGAMIETGTVRASTLEGGEVNLLDGSGRTAGSFTLEGAASYSGQKVIMSSGAIELNAEYGDIYISNGEGAYINITDENGERFSSFGCNIGSSQSGLYDCGMSTREWNDVYASNSVIQTSDATKKKDISYDLLNYSYLFDQLKPCLFRFVGQHNRKHMGLIAQDVETAMQNCNISSQDMAAFIKNDGGYALRYGEFIPLLIYEVQKLKGEVKKINERQNKTGI